MSFAFLHWKKIVEKNLTSRQVATRISPQSKWQQVSHLKTGGNKCLTSRQVASWTSSKSTSAQGSALPAITTTQPNLRPSYRKSAKRSTHQQWCQARITEIQAYSEAEVQWYKNTEMQDPWTMTGTQQISNGVK